MLIPSIDLMGGKIVQLVQGDKKKLEFDNVDFWIERFRSYPVVQLIDLDAARGTGDNLPLVRQIVRRLKCQIGGGIRTVGAAHDLLDAGAQRVIIGSALMKDGAVDVAQAREFGESIGEEALVFALDSRGGRVAIDGWKTATAITAVEMVQALDAFCETFLYTNIDTEGLMGGLPMKPVHALRLATARRLIVAGGITQQEEIDTLDALGIDAVVGMALYSGKIQG